MLARTAPSASNYERDTVTAELQAPQLLTDTTPPNVGKIVGGSGTFGSVAHGSPSAKDFRKPRYTAQVTNNGAAGIVVVGDSYLFDSGDTIQNNGVGIRAIEKFGGARRHSDHLWQRGRSAA